MGEREGEHSGNYVSSAPTLGGLMICLMFLTIMCLATQKNILCKLLKLYHQQQHEQSGREQGGEGEGGEEEKSRVWHLISHSLGPHPWIHLPLRLLSPLCHRLCLLSNVNGVAFACLAHPLPPATYPPPVVALLFCPHASNFLAVINLGLLWRDSSQK